jgi:phenol 2-monooxygenase (NADPH)
LPDSSILCVDQKPGTLQTGQADGLQPRTLEVLESLGLGDEILAEGCQLWEVAFWNAAEGGQGPGTGGIERTGYAADVVVRARFPHEVTIHQGRIERIISEDLAKYSSNGVQHSTRFKDFRVEESSNSSFPLVIDLEVKDEESGKITPQKIRAKHIVAADGAHSPVRAAAGLELVGESRDYIWGVVDFVADTDFPDVRRRTAIHSVAGSAMVIPRERIATGEYLTRLYIQMDDVEIPDEPLGRTRDPSLSEIENARKQARGKRQRIQLETLFQQAEAVFQPYYLRMRDGQEPDWWAAYQIGQRMTNAFTKEDEHGISRVFVVGDGKFTFQL